MKKDSFWKYAKNRMNQEMSFLPGCPPSVERVSLSILQFDESPPWVGRVGIESSGCRFLRLPQSEKMVAFSAAS